MATVKRCDVCGYISEPKDFKQVGLNVSYAEIMQGYSIEKTKDLCVECYESLLRNFNRGDYKCDITPNRGNTKNKP